MTFIDLDDLERKARAASESWSEARFNPASGHPLGEADFTATLPGPVGIFTVNASPAVVLELIEQLRHAKGKPASPATGAELIEAFQRDCPNAFENIGAVLADVGGGPETDHADCNPDFCDKAGAPLGLAFAEEPPCSCDESLSLKRQLDLATAEAGSLLMALWEAIDGNLTEEVLSIAKSNGTFARGWVDEFVQRRARAEAADARVAELEAAASDARMALDPLVNRMLEGGAPATALELGGVRAAIDGCGVTREAEAEAT